jgi:hypothetical protein
MSDGGSRRAGCATASCTPGPFIPHCSGVRCRSRSSLREFAARGDRGSCRPIPGMSALLSGAILWERQPLRSGVGEQARLDGQHSYHRLHWHPPRSGSGLPYIIPMIGYAGAGRGRGRGPGCRTSAGIPPCPVPLARLGRLPAGSVGAPLQHALDHRSAGVQRRPCPARSAQAGRREAPRRRSAAATAQSGPPR